METSPSHDDSSEQSQDKERLLALEEENKQLRRRLEQRVDLPLHGVLLYVDPCYSIGGHGQADMTHMELSNHLMRNTDFYRQFCDRVDPCLLLPSLALPGHLEELVRNLSTYFNKLLACQALWVGLRRESEWPERLACALDEYPSTADLGNMVREGELSVNENGTEQRRAIQGPLPGDHPDLHSGMQALDRLSLMDPRTPPALPEGMGATASKPDDPSFKVKSKVAANARLSEILSIVEDNLVPEDVRKITDLVPGWLGRQPRRAHELLTMLKEKGLVVPNDVIYLQALLWNIGRTDLFKQVAECVKKIHARKKNSPKIAHLDVPSLEPVNGYEYVKFHVHTTSERLSDDLKMLRDQLIDVLRVPEEFVKYINIVSGRIVQSILIVLAMPTFISHHFLDHFYHPEVQESLADLQVDYVLFHHNCEVSGPERNGEEKQAARRHLRRVQATVSVLGILIMVYVAITSFISIHFNLLQIAGLLLWIGVVTGAIFCFHLAQILLIYAKSRSDASRTKWLQVTLSVLVLMGIVITVIISFVAILLNLGPGEYFLLWVGMVAGVVIRFFWAHFLLSDAKRRSDASPTDRLQVTLLVLVLMGGIVVLITTFVSFLNNLPSAGGLLLSVGLVAGVVIRFFWAHFLLSDAKSRSDASPTDRLQVMLSVLAILGVVVAFIIFFGSFDFNLLTAQNVLLCIYLVTGVMMGFSLVQSLLIYAKSRSGAFQLSGYRSRLQDDRQRQAYTANRPASFSLDETLKSSLQDDGQRQTLTANRSSLLFFVRDYKEQLFGLGLLCTGIISIVIFSVYRDALVDYTGIPNLPGAGIGFSIVSIFAGGIIVLPEVGLYFIMFWHVVRNWIVARQRQKQSRHGE